MKLYYLASSAAVEANTHLFREWHAVPLSKDLQLVAILFADEGGESAWREVQGVKPLPHLLAGGPVGGEIAAALASLGVTGQHTTFDVAEAAGKVHPLMRARVL